MTFRPLLFSAAAIATFLVFTPQAEAQYSCGPGFGYGPGPGYGYGPGPGYGPSHDYYRHRHYESYFYDPWCDDVIIEIYPPRYFHEERRIRPVRKEPQRPLKSYRGPGEPEPKEGNEG